MAGTIKGITIEIGGDTQKLTNAIKGLNTESQDLQCELRHVEKLLKLDPTNTELLAQKQTILAESITTTSEKLNILKEAENQLSKQLENGDITTEEYASQHRALQREIMFTENRMSDLERQAAECHEKIQTFSDKMQGLGEGLTDAGKKAAGFSAAGAAVVGGMTALATSAAASADDINTLSKVTGISTDELQKFAYATDLIDVSQETLSGSLTKLTSNMKNAKDGSESAQEKFAALGLTFRDEVTGELRNSQEVFYEAIDALAEIENETERDAAAMDLFGKSAKDLNPLILGGADALKELGQEAEDLGLILSQDALDAANAFNDVIDKTKGQVSATKDVVGAAIAEAFLPLAETIAGVIQTIAGKVRELDGTTLTIIGTIAAVVAVVAPLLIGLGQLAFGVNQIITLMPLIISGLTSLGSTFSFLLGPIGAIIAIVAVLVAGFIYLWNTNEEFKEGLIEIWETIKDFLVTTLENIANFFTTTFEAIKTLIGAFIKLAKGDFKGFLNDMVTLVRDIIPRMIQAGKDMFTGLWDGMKEIWSSLWSWVGDVTSQLVDKLAFWRSSKDEMDEGADGSHAQGLAYVPKDGYRAILHEGEAVLTKAENKEYREGRNTGTGTVAVTQNFYDKQDNPAAQQRAARRELIKLGVVEVQNEA